MSDPIDRMDQFRTDIEGGPMLPAADVRRRGDQLRRRRTAAVSAGAALAVAAIVTPVALLATNGTTTNSEPGPAADPTQTTSSESAPAPTLTEDNLLRDEDTVFTDDVRWTLGDTYAGDGQAALYQCEQRSLTDLGAAAVFRRDWFVDSGIHALGQAIAEFPTAADARRAYDEIRGWLAECPSLAPENAYDATTTPVDIRGEGEAQLTSATFDLDPGDTAEQAGEAYYEIEQHTGVVIAGDRLTVLNHSMPESQSYDGTWWSQVTPTELMLQPAAQRLAEEAPAGGAD